jgi:hypothetical protein
MFYSPGQKGVFLQNAILHFALAGMRKSQLKIVPDDFFAVAALGEMRSKN